MQWQPSFCSTIPSTQSEDLPALTMLVVMKGLIGRKAAKILFINTGLLTLELCHLTT